MRPGVDSDFYRGLAHAAVLATILWGCAFAVAALLYALVVP